MASSKRIDQRFHAAVDREASARTTYLLEACKDDDSLRAEVEALIASHEKGSRMIENGASNPGSDLLPTQDRAPGAEDEISTLPKTDAHLFAILDSISDS